MGQVFISQWENEFKTKTFDTFKAVYDFIRKLARIYDISDSNTMKLTSSYKAKNGNGGNGAKNGNGNGTEKSNGSAAGGTGNGGNGAFKKRDPKCVLCSGNHWAFKLHQLKGAYAQPYGDGKFIEWECPRVGEKKEDVKSAAWIARCKEIKDRNLAFQRAKDAKT